jgi:hypothetical protein
LGGFREQWRGAVQVARPSDRPVEAFAVLALDALLELRWWRP